MPNLKFLAQTVLEIWRGSQNSNSKSRDTFLTPFDLLLFIFIVSDHGDESAGQI